MNVLNVKSEDEFINPEINDDEVNELATQFSKTQLVCVNKKESDLPPLILADEINGNEIEVNSTRKCSYCRDLCQHPIQVCGGCKKRAYCSQYCQKMDWSVTGSGQRHVNWCTLYECGEEDVDWKVIPIPDKGLGIIAKRFIPAGYRILADPVYTDPRDHPGILQLAPEGASLELKFETNSIQGEASRDGGKNYVGLRISRANHDCYPNAGYVHDETARVEILFAQRDIHPGQEICISYGSFADLDLDRPTAGLSTHEEEYESVQKTLKTSWGISCPSNCYCKDDKVNELVSKGRKIQSQLSNLVVSGRIEEALEIGEELIEIHKSLDISWTRRAAAEFYCAQIALRKVETLDRAEKHLREAYEVYKLICPYSELKTKTCERFLENPEADTINYLSMNNTQWFPLDFEEDFLSSQSF